MALRDWGNLIKSGGQSVGTSARNMTEIAKRNGQIQEANKRINDYYTELGKAYFALHSGDSEPALSDLVGNILREMGIIQMLGEEIKQIKGVVKCPVCGSENGNGAQFCSSCGSPLIVRQAPQPAVAPPTIFCTNCGAKLMAGMAFCTSCGSPTAGQTMPAPKQSVPAPEPEPEPAPAPPQTVETAAPEGSGVCPVCGHTIEPGMAFCIECGTPVNREMPAMEEAEEPGRVEEPETDAEAVDTGDES